MERAAFLTAWSAKTLRGVCMCSVGTHGNAATRMEQLVPSEGQYAYGLAHVDALWKQQARETDKASPRWDWRALFWRYDLGPIDLGPLGGPELTDAQSLCLHLAFRVGATGAETPVNLA